MSGPCLCGDPGCGRCFPVGREPGDNEIVLVELPGGEVIQTRYGELPDYGDAFSWGEEEPPAELEEALAEIDEHGEKLFYRLYNDDRGTIVEDFPGFIFEEDNRFAFPPDGAALATEAYLVCVGFVEAHSVEGVFLDPDVAFEFAKKLVEKEEKSYGDPYVRSLGDVEGPSSAPGLSGNEIAVWSRMDQKIGPHSGTPNRLIGYVSVERHFIRRRDGQEAEGRGREAPSEAGDERHQED
jgi:hypothetical protein